MLGCRVSGAGCLTLQPPPRTHTQVGWNAGGTVVVAAFGRPDTGGWCAQGGCLAAWPLFRRDFDPAATPEVQAPLR